MECSNDAAVGAALAWLARRSELRLALLFGSAARGELGPASDLDVAVLGGRALSAAHKLELIEGLARASGRPVDLVDLATVGQPLLGRILAEGQRLFGTDEDYASLIVRNVFDRADFLPYQERILEERRRRWIGS